MLSILTFLSSNFVFVFSLFMVNKLFSVGDNNDSEFDFMDCHSVISVNKLMVYTDRSFTMPSSSRPLSVASVSSLSSDSTPSRPGSDG